VHQCLFVGSTMAWLSLSACGPHRMVNEGQTGPSSSDASFDYKAYIDAVYNAHNPDAVDKFFTSDVIVHSLAPGGEDGTGTDYLKGLAKGLLEAFPDAHLTVEEVVREGDKLSARVTVEGTHKGEFAGIKPTGRSVKVQNFAVYRVRGDKICEVWSLTDLAQLRIQLTEKK